MEMFWFILVCGGFVAFIIYSIHFCATQRETAENELYYLVEQTGGKNIEVRYAYQPGTQGVLQFIVSYRDSSGMWQSHDVSRNLDIWGRLTGEFLWNQPLQSNPSENLFTPLSSKEQIISDMDAEIKRLQKELELSRRGTS